MSVLSPYRTALADLAATDRLRALAPRGGIDFASNDYLALASSPRIKKAVTAKKAATKTATPAPRGRAQDRALISAKQRYEVSYEAAATGHSAADVKAAIEKFGHSRVKVRKALTEK